MLFDVVVTRHNELVQYLKEINVVDNDVEVIEHATVENIKDKNVIGVLPHSLSCLTETFAEVPLNIPLEMRGKPLTLEQIREYAQPLTAYIVRELIIKE